MEENEISRKVIGAAIEVHKVLGPGLLESAYEMSLERELKIRGLNVRRQVALPLVYKGEKCDIGYRIDLLVENKVIVENSFAFSAVKSIIPYSLLPLQIYFLSEQAHEKPVELLAHLFLFLLKQKKDLLNFELHS